MPPDRTQTSLLLSEEASEELDHNFTTRAVMEYFHLITLFNMFSDGILEVDNNVTINSYMTLFLEHGNITDTISER